MLVALRTAERLSLTLVFVQMTPCVCACSSTREITVISIRAICRTAKCNSLSRVGVEGASERERWTKRGRESKAIAGVRVRANANCGRPLLQNQSRVPPPLLLSPEIKHSLRYGFLPLYKRISLVSDTVLDTTAISLLSLAARARVYTYTYSPARV